MLCANHGSVTFKQSVDCAAQSMDPRFAQTIHGLYNSCAIQGLRNSHVRGRLTRAEVRLVRASWLKGKPLKNISLAPLLKKSGCDPSSV